MSHFIDLVAMVGSRENLTGVGVKPPNLQTGHFNLQVSSSRATRATAVLSQVNQESFIKRSISPT